MSALEKVQLKDGSTVAEAAILATWMNLDLLMDTNPLALFEAAMIARNSAHVPFGNLGQALVDLNLIDADGIMHDDTRHVILSAMPGEGLDMKLVNPRAGR